MEKYQSELVKVFRKTLKLKLDRGDSDGKLAASVYLMIHGCDDHECDAAEYRKSMRKMIEEVMGEYGREFMYNSNGK